MPTLRLTNTVLGTKIWALLEDNSASYSTDLTTKVTVGKSAVGTYFRIEPGTTNSTSGDYNLVSGGNGWRQAPVSVPGSFSGGDWTFSVKLQNDAKYAFSVRMAARLRTQDINGNVYRDSSYGSSINAVAQDNSYVYVGGYPTNTIKKYLKDTMVLQTESPSYGGTITTLVVDDTYIYAGGGVRVKKYLKSDLSYVSQSADLNGSHSVYYDDGTYLYCGDYSGNVRKLLKSDLSVVGSITNFGGAIGAVTGDGTYIYVGGYVNLTIKKYLASDLSYVTQSPSYGGTIYALACDGTYVYAGGASTFRIRRYTKSDMAYVSESASYGGSIMALAISGDNIYAAGDTTYRVRKYALDGLGYTSESATYGYIIRSICCDNGYVYAGGDSLNNVRRYSNWELFLSVSPNTMSLPGSAGSQVTDSWTASVPQIYLSTMEYLIAEYRLQITSAASNSSAGCSFVVDENPSTGDESIVTTSFLSGDLFTKTILGMGKVLGTARRQIGNSLSEVIGVLDSVRRHHTQLLVNLTKGSGTARRLSFQGFGVKRLTALGSVIRSKVAFKIISGIARVAGSFRRQTAKVLNPLTRLTSSARRWSDQNLKAASSGAGSARRLKSKLFQLKRLTMSSSSRRQSNKPFAKRVTSLSSVRRHGVQIINAAIRAANSIKCDITKQFTKVITAIGSVVRDFISGMIEKVLVVSIRTTGLARRFSAKAFSRLISTVGQVRRQSRKLFSKVIDAASLLSRRTNQIVMAGIKEIVTLVKWLTQNITGKVQSSPQVRRSSGQLLSVKSSATGLIEKQLSKLFTRMIRTSGTLKRQTLKVFSRVIGISGLVNRLKVFMKTLIKIVISSSWISRNITQRLSAVISPSSQNLKSSVNELFHRVISGVDLIKLAQKSFFRTIRTTSEIIYTKVIIKLLGTLLKGVATARRFSFQMLTGVAKNTGEVRRRSYRRLLGAVSTMSVVRRNVAKSLATLHKAMPNFTKASLKGLHKIITTTVTFQALGHIFYTYFKMLSAITESSPLLLKSVRRTLRSVLSVTRLVLRKRGHVSVKSRNLSLSAIERQVLLEVEGGDRVAYIGDTIRLIGRFHDFSGNLADITGETITIYDGKKNVLVTDTPVHQDTGIYTYDFTIPDCVSDPVVYEFSGTLEGSVILARSTIKRRWV